MMRFPFVCHTNKWFVPAAFRTRAVVAAKRRPLESPADDQQARLFGRLCRSLENWGLRERSLSAEKEAKRAIYDFFGLLIAGKRGKGGVYFDVEENK